MKELNKKELMKIEGGFSLSGSIINAFTSAVKTIVDLGRSLGSSIRRISTNNLCKL